MLLADEEKATQVGPKNLTFTQKKYSMTNNMVIRAMPNLSENNSSQ